jgi:hypothetical protein
VLHVQPPAAVTEVLIGSAYSPADLSYRPAIGTVNSVYYSFIHIVFVVFVTFSKEHVGIVVT